VRFERGYLLLENPGKNMTAVKPKRVARIDDYTISVDTGFWNYGRIQLKFDAVDDAQRLMQEITEITLK
jgi:hypothetical protein